MRAGALIVPKFVLQKCSLGAALSGLKYANLSYMSVGCRIGWNFAFPYAVLSICSLTEVHHHDRGSFGRYSFSAEMLDSMGW
jgi:hypothetical protein